MIHDLQGRYWKAWLAWLLSGLLSPFVLVPGFAAVLLVELTSTRDQFLQLYLLCVACTTGVPALYIGYQVFYGRITDMHVRLLEQRRGPFRAGVCGLASMAVALELVGAPSPLQLFAWAVLLNGTLFALISERWKISVHTGTLGALLAAALVLLHWSPAWLLLQGPLVWARAYRKRHHIAQGLAGALLGFVPIWLFLLWGA